MNSRERVMAALQLKEPDRVPFMDFVDTVVKQEIMGTDEIDEVKFAKEKWGDRICLWGNIDLVQTLPYGTVEEVEVEVRQRIREAGPGGGYICATANSVTGWCKIENIFAMTAAVKKYGVYPIQLD